MNKETLEKMFDEKFNLQSFIWESMFDTETIFMNEKVKSFIFETIIPEVIKEITNLDLQENSLISKWKLLTINEIKQKAKESFWIEL